MTNTLREMLTYCRPMGSRHEALFRAQFLLTLPGAYEDAGFNIHVHVDDAPILWSAHTDTVHTRSDRQHVEQRGAFLCLPEGSRSNCLGADDTVGCFLMREMILARVPGHYVFHHGEERGGVGSSWLARHHADWLSTFRYAIALDRADTGDVITHQFGGRTASNTFALALAEALGEGWAPAHGVYTDTAEYADHIAECTNLSVGYYCQHSAREHVDVAHVYALLSKLYTLDVCALPASREPGDDDRYDDYAYRAIDWHGMSGYVADRDECDTCAWLRAVDWTEQPCPDCGRAVSDDDDDNAFYDDETCAACGWQDGPEPLNGLDYCPDCGLRWQSTAAWRRACADQKEVM